MIRQQVILLLFSFPLNRVALADYAAIFLHSSAQALHARAHSWQCSFW